MSQPYIGQISLFAFNFAPRNFAVCGGQLMPISQNQALFALIGTSYGGDGVTTFGLPDLRGRAAIHRGTGLGPTYTVGDQGGVETVALTAAQLPLHAHNPVVAGVGGNTASTPAGARVASGGPTLYAPTTGTGAQMPLETAGGGLPHDNMAPYLVLNWSIALFGIFPSP